MDDLISRSAAIEALKDALCMTGYQSRSIDAVRFLPTVCAVKVVRCKDCKEYETDCGFCDYWETGRNFDDYCSRGVRKEDANAPQN